MTDREIELSRRKILGSIGAVGAAGALGGAATNALLWDEEVFGSAEAPNVLQAGTLDLKVDWEEHYYDALGSEAGVPARHVDGPEDIGEGEVGLPTGTDPMVAVPEESLEDFMGSTITEQSEPTDVDDPVVTIEDVKPGDFGEVTLGYHVQGNPGWVSLCADVLSDGDNGVDEAEDGADGVSDDSDGDPFVGGGGEGELDGLVTGADDPDVVDSSAFLDDDFDGELGNLVQATLWYDLDCDNLLDDGEPVDLVLTFDASGSMLYDQYGGLVSDEPIDVDGDGTDEHSETTKIDLVEKGARTFVEAFDDSGIDAQIGVVYFDGYQEGDTGSPNIQTHALTDDLASLIAPGGPLTDMRDVVASLTGGGTDPGNGGGIDTGTALAEGIDEAQSVLAASARDVQSVNLLFTDAEPFEPGAGSIPESRYQEVEDAADDARSASPSPATDVYVAADQSSRARAQELAEYIAGPAGTTGNVPGDDEFVSDIGDPLAIPTVFRRLTVAFLGDVVIAEGTLNQVLQSVGAFDGGCQLLDPINTGGRVAGDYLGTDCHQAGERGCVALEWHLPRDIPGFDDNVVQTDRYEFTVGFEAVQCRHNVADDGGPIAFPGDAEASSD